MILTGSKIIEEIKAGNIIITPFNKKQVNPNSYNYRLGSVLKIFNGFNDGKSVFIEKEIPSDGIVIEPGKMYLGHTEEVIGSSVYAMSLIGKSSIGRLGLFLQVSANLGHTTSEHKWTLEIVAARKIVLYTGMIIGQVSFWKNYGEINKYNGKYGFISHPQESYLPQEKNDFNRKKNNRGSKKK